jgi:hypothetical protein
MMATMLRALAAVVVAAAVALVARDVAACKCGYDGTAITAPRFTGPLELREASAELRCDSAAHGYITCTWTAFYQLHNPGEARTIELDIGHIAGARVALFVDGAFASRPAADLAARRRAVDRGERAGTSVQWDAPAGGETLLTVEANFLVSPWTCPCQYPTNSRRHPWVTRWRSADYYVNYRPGDEFSAAPPTYSLVHDIPARWSGYRPHGPEHRRQGSRSIAAVTRARPTADRYDEGGRISAERPLRLDPGGPIVAAGLGWSPEGLRPRLRVGWELAWPKLLVHSLVVETDARRRLTLIPAWELAIPEWHVVFPDLGVGLGVPVQLLPDARPGVRVQGRFGFWIFHIIGAWDHYPAVRGLPHENHGALMLQVGF